MGNPAVCGNFPISSIGYYAFGPTYCFEPGPYEVYMVVRVVVRYTVSLVGAITGGAPSPAIAKRKQYIV